MTEPAPLPTFDDGKFETLALMRGDPTRGLYLGRRVSDGNPILVSVAHNFWKADLVDPIKFDVPGVAPLLHIGPPDGYRRPPYQVATPAGVIELSPSGTPLDRIQRRPSTADLVRWGGGLLAVVRAAVARRVELRGLRPETTYVVESPSGWSFGGAAPRSVRVLGFHGDGPYGSPFEQHSYEPPEPLYRDEFSPTADLFSWALVVWWAHTRRHAYRVTPNNTDDWVMSQDDRPAFPGPAELGRVLERVLIADPAKRPSVDEVAAWWSTLDSSAKEG